MPNNRVYWNPGNEEGVKLANARRAAAELLREALPAMVADTINKVFAYDDSHQELDPSADTPVRLIKLDPDDHLVPDLKVEVRMPTRMYARRAVIRQQLIACLKPLIYELKGMCPSTYFELELVREDSCGAVYNLETGETEAGWGAPGEKD